MKMDSERRAIDKIFKRRDRYEIPEWQRGEVWTEDKRQTLIDTILRGWHLPKFYFVRVDDVDEYYEVVDGQQRLSAIFDFCSGDLKLSAGTAHDFGGATYAELPARVSDKFDDFEIQYEEITDASESELAEIFRRLQFGVPLTPDERLNAIPSGLRDYSWSLARHRFFAEKVSAPDRRYAHFGVCVRFAYLEIEGIPSSLRLDQLESLLGNNATYPSTSASARRMRKAVDWLDRAFAERSSALRNRSSVLALLRLASFLTDAGATNEMGKGIGAFFESFERNLRTEVQKGSDATDADLVRYQQTVTSNLTSGNAIRDREAILRKKLFLHNPSLLGELTEDVSATSTIGQDVRRMGDQVAEQIFALNSWHAGVHGEDMFKLTNRAAKALKRIGGASNSRESYGDFVDDLYLLAYEGSGNGKRFPQGLPPSVKDIRDLRTQLRHDVDHGSAGAARKKRRELGSVFRKYAGVESPEVLSDQAFAFVQVGFLTALLDDLTRISQAIGATAVSNPQP